MTNAERFRNPDERFEEFRKFCKDRNCENCPCQGLVSGSTKKCAFVWLDLEYKEKKELKPCPFCGSKSVEIFRSDNLDSWRVSCDDCGVTTNGETSEEIAITVWNRRV